MSSMAIESSIAGGRPADGEVAPVSVLAPHENLPMHRISRRFAFGSLALVAACGSSGEGSDHAIADAPELAGKAFYEADLDGL